jgi:hypothetical protein
MKPSVQIRPGELDRKPRHGEPCNSCGLCCRATLCPLGQWVFRQHLGPCPALRVTDGKSSCGLVAEPARHALQVVLKNGAQKASEAALHLIGSGHGCDARFAGEKPDEAFYARLRQHDRETRAQSRAAKKVWGMP